MKRALILFALALGCVTERSDSPKGADLYRVERTDPMRAWHLVEGAAVLGTVVQFGDRARPDDPSLWTFSVRNPFQQELGMLDGLGRIWRYRPHEREAELLGSGTVVEGARRVLGATPDAELVSVQLEALRTTPASAQE